jgi:hypothetical protein
VLELHGIMPFFFVGSSLAFLSPSSPFIYFSFTHFIFQLVILFRVFPLWQPSDQMTVAVSLLALVAFAFSDANATANPAPSPPASPPGERPPALPSADDPYADAFNGRYGDDDYGYYNDSRYYNEEYGHYVPSTLDPEVRKLPCRSAHSRRDRWGYCTCDDAY